MSYPINYPTPQGANVQIFNPTGGISASEWVKPQGASFVWFTLIGGGSGGNGAAAGGSGAVTNFMCPAFLIPDILNIRIGAGAFNANGVQTIVSYQQKIGTGYTLLTANPGSVGGTAGTAMTANAFTAMGFFQSIAGDAGGTSAASGTTFLQGGDSGAGTTTTNYGYSQTNGAGFFQMQPIIVGAGGLGSNKGGVGCGGGTNGAGGDGMVVIITW